MSLQILGLRNLYGLSIVILMLCIGLYTVPFSTMGNTLTFIPGDTGDATLNNYFLENGFQWLSGNQKSFWNAPFFYPEPQVMTFSDNFLGTMPVYSVFRFSGFDRETAFQLWIITIFMLNYICCVWVLRRFLISLPGAAVGAFIFTFSLPVIARLNHIQLLPRFMVPLAFYFGWKYLNKPDLKSLAGLCLSIVGQLYCTIYIGFFLLLALAAFVLSFAIINAKHYEWREILWGSKSVFAYRAAIMIASGLILLPLLLPYYKTSLEYGLRDWSEISTMLPRFRSLVLPANGSLLWGWLRPLGDVLPMAWEHEIFIGALPWLAVATAIFGIFKKDNNDTKEICKAATVCILLILLSVMCWNGVSFYKFIALLPGARSIRAVTRIILVLSFLFAISTGVLFTRLEHFLSKKTLFLSTIISLVLLSILIADQYVLPLSTPRYLKSDIQARSREVADEVMKKRPSAKVFAYMPSKGKDPSYAIHMHAMLASQSIHIPTINGYSGSIPRNYDFYRDYDKLWALKKWIVFTKAKYGSRYISDDSMFNGLVIVGSHEEDIDDSRLISIAREPLPNEGFKAKIAPAYEKITAMPNASIRLPVKVTNKSNVTWPVLGDLDGRNKISLSCRWLSLDGEQIEGYTERYPLQYDLPSGESITLDAEIKAPSKSGIYILEFDMVQELVSWFSNKGSKTARVEIKAE